MNFRVSEKIQIGVGCPVFVIAEAGVNHNGDLGLAKELVDAAAAARADAVKFQTFDVARLLTHAAPKAAYQTRTSAADQSQFEMLCRLQLSAAAHRELRSHCQKRGILFLSTPFDEASVDLLCELEVPLLKIPSGEITNLPFLAHAAGKRKPLLISTGMSTLEEIGVAVQTVRVAGDSPLALLQCVSNYPTAPADANLRAMQTMATAFGVPVGYSDHTTGISVALAAAALGACVIEKHFTLDRRLEGPDHQASLEPEELREMVANIRVVESAMGDGKKLPVASEAEIAVAVRKSLVAACDIASGTRLTEAMIAIKRPGSGLAPSLRRSLVGHVARRDICEDTLLTWEMLQ